MSLPEPFPVLLPLYDPMVARSSPGVVFPLLASGGARWVEYRDKRACDRDFLAAARRALAAARNAGLTLLVNDRVDVAAALGSGVHLGQQDLPVAVARRLLGPEAVIGLSADGLDDVAAAASLAVDYVAVGPVYATGSKPDAGVAVGLAHVAAARARSERPLVAIGGIGPETAADVTGAGADCVAVLSAILLAPDIAEATRRLRAAALQGRARRPD